MAKLNEKQIAAIEYMALPKRGGLTYVQIAEKVGVSEQTIHRWKNDDTFYNALSRTIVRNTQDRLPELFDAAIDGVITEKNAALFRTLIQAHGLLTEKVEDVTKGSGDVTAEDMKAQLAKFKKSQAEGGETKDD